MQEVPGDEIKQVLVWHVVMLEVLREVVLYEDRGVSLL